MNALTWFLKLNKGVGGFWSTENPSKAASNSEIRRWFLKGSVLINGERLSITSTMPALVSCVLHPSSKHRITVF